MQDLTNIKESIAVEERELQNEFEESQKQIKEKVAEYEAKLTQENTKQYSLKVATLNGKKEMLATVEKMMNQNV